MLLDVNERAHNSCEGFGVMKRHKWVKCPVRIPLAEDWLVIKQPERLRDSHITIQGIEIWLARVPFWILARIYEGK